MRPFARVTHELAHALAPFDPAIAGRIVELAGPNATAEMMAYRVCGFVDGYIARSAPTPRQDMAMMAIRRLASELLDHCREREARLSGAA